MNKENVKFAVIVIAALILGAAYGDRIPVISTVAPKLPGARA